MAFKSFRAAVAQSIAGQTLTLGLGGAFLLLSARWLGPTERGEQALLQSVGQFGAAILGLGMAGVVPMLLGRTRGATSWVVNVQGRVALAQWGIATLAIAITGRMLYPALVGREVVLGLTVAGLASQLIFFNAALASGDARSPNVSSVVGAAISLVLLVGARLAGRLDVDAALWAQLIGVAIGTAANARGLLYGRAATAAVVPTRAELRMLRLPAFQGYLSSFLALALFRADIFVVERVGGGLRVAGVYAVSVFVAELFLKVPQWASTVLTASVAMDAEKGAQRTVTLCVTSILVSALCFAPLVVAAPFFDAMAIRVLGTGYAGLAFILVALMPRVLMQSGVVVLAGSLAGRGYTWYHPLASGAGLVGVMSADALLAPRLGAVGAAIGSSLGYSLAALVMFGGYLVTEGITLREFGTMASTAIRVLRRGLAGVLGRSQPHDAPEAPR